MNYFRSLPASDDKPHLLGWKRWTKDGPTKRSRAAEANARTYRTQLLHRNGGYEWRLLGSYGDMGGKGWAKTVDAARSAANAKRQALATLAVADQTKDNT